jgi:hypothetical protein
MKLILILAASRTVKMLHMAPPDLAALLINYGADTDLQDCCGRALLDLVFLGIGSMDLNRDLICVKSS